MLADVDMPNDTHATVLRPTGFAGSVGPGKVVIGAVYLLRMFDAAVVDELDCADDPDVPEEPCWLDELHAARARTAAVALTANSPVPDLFIVSLSNR
jgi:hypothetical protein